ncbi:hypothetical protein CRX72_09200 [Pantoea sp. BRM17]|nr:hypothetical protein CRX72_09200 [Pantoea sp. BRM17]
MLTNEAYKPINCDDYDNLELACTRHWMLSLQLKNGDQLKAKALALADFRETPVL